MIFQSSEMLASEVLKHFTGQHAPILVNVHQEDFIDPTNCPWVSEDGMHLVCVKIRLRR